MKIASYNVENLFLRAHALNLTTWDEGRDALKQQSDLNALLGKTKYSAADKKKIVELLTDLGLDKRDDGGKWAILRQHRGRLIKRPNNKPVEVVAGGRGEWIGWVDLKVEEVNEVATRMTGKVIEDVNADVLGVIEAESRPALQRFSSGVLQAAVGGAGYPRVMLIDGNDERGIDVGIMARGEWEIVSMRSHVDDEDASGTIFSRDCAEYAMRSTKSGKSLVVLVNHFKSKGYGSQASSNAKRKRQAQRVKEIYEAIVGSGQPNVAVIGDLNDTPDSDALSPLLQNTDLADISTLQGFDDGANGQRPGTYANGTKSNKIDYVLLSPSLFAKATAGGIFRMGVWGGKNGDLFPHYPEITAPHEAASDHAAIWAEVTV